MSYKLNIVSYVYSIEVVPEFLEIFVDENYQNFGSNISDLSNFVEIRKDVHISLQGKSVIVASKEYGKDTYFIANVKAVSVNGSIYKTPQKIYDNLVEVSIA